LAGGFIFDMGNVLSRNVEVLPAIARRLGLTVEQILGFAGESLAGLLTGRATAEEFWRALNRHFGTDVREDLWLTLFHPANDRRIERLILRLKAAGYAVVCGTNTIAGHYRHHLEHGEYAVFERVYASHRIGAAKPAPEFFLHILKAEGWQAREVFFIDDSAEHVAAAGELGIRSHHYRRFGTLREWLAAERVFAAS